PLAHAPPLAPVPPSGGHPLSCPAGPAALEVLLRDDLPARAARLGDRLRARLAALVGHGGLVAVRGIGLLLELEFTRADLCAAFAGRALAAGLILAWTLHRDTVVRPAPPLLLIDTEADEPATLIRRLPAR